MPCISFFSRLVYVFEKVLVPEVNETKIVVKSDPSHKTLIEFPLENGNFADAHLDDSVAQLMPNPGK